MKLKLNESVKHVTGEQLGSVHLLFNTSAGSWVAIRENVYEFLQTATQGGHDPIALGLGMGFSNEELNQFLTYLNKLSILANGHEKVNAPQHRLQKCYFHVDQACNLKCPTCYSWRPGRNSRKNELTTDLVGEALSQMRALGLTELVISGGEPLIRRDIVEILRLAKEVHQIDTVVLLTNGTLVTEKIATVIARYADVVSISVDGFTEEENAKIRGPGSFKKAVEGIKAFQKAGVRIVNLLPTITHQNVHHLDEFKALAEELGTFITFSMFLTIGAGGQTEAVRDLELTHTDMAYLAQKIAAGNPENVIVMEPCAVGLQATDGCGIGCKLISIDYDGTVYPCHMTMQPKLKMGKYPESTIQDILVSSPLSAYFQALNVDRIYGCGECSFRYFCGGGCRASAYANAQDLQAHDPGCSFYKPALTKMLEPIVLAANASG